MQLFLIMGNSFLDRYLVKMKSNRKKKNPYLLHKESKALFIRKALQISLVHKKIINMTYGSLGYLS